MRRYSEKKMTRRTKPLSMELLRNQLIGLGPKDEQIQEKHRRASKKWGR
jgi:hypothetical protein